MASEKDKALRKKVMADNPQKMGESNADYQDRINKLFNAKNPDQPVAVGASTAQRREGQEKKKAKEEASRRNAKVDFKRDGILTRGSVYYTKDGKMVVAGTAPGNSVAPKEMYDRDGNLIYKGGQKVKGKDEGVVKRTDMPKKQEEKPKAQAAKPKAQPAKPKPAPKREEVKMEKMKKREAAPIATKKSEIKLAEPKGEMKSKESETKETPRQAATRKRSAKKEGKQQARKDTRAGVAQERKEMKSLRDQIAVAKTQERGDKRVSRAKSKREKLEARLKALRS